MKILHIYYCMDGHQRTIITTVTTTTKLVIDDNVFHACTTSSSKCETAKKTQIIFYMSQNSSLIFSVSVFFLHISINNISNVSNIFIHRLIYVSEIFVYFFFFFLLSLFVSRFIFIILCPFSANIVFTIFFILM